MPSSNVKQRPNLSDFLDVRASISGYQAFRNTGVGIIFEHMFFCYVSLSLAVWLLIFIMQDLT